MAQWMSSAKHVPGTHSKWLGFLILLSDFHISLNAVSIQHQDQLCILTEGLSCTEVGGEGSKRYIVSAPAELAGWGWTDCKCQWVADIGLTSSACSGFSCP